MMNGQKKFLERFLYLLHLLLCLQPSCLRKASAADYPTKPIVAIVPLFLLVA